MLEQDDEHRGRQREPSTGTDGLRRRASREGARGAGGRARLRLSRRRHHAGLRRPDRLRPAPRPHPPPSWCPPPRGPARSAGRLRHHGPGASGRRQEHDRHGRPAGGPGLLEIDGSLSFSGRLLAELGGAATRVVVGADAVGQRRFVNVCGTAVLLELAAARSVPAVVVADTGKNLPESEIDELLKLPPHRFWKKLKETHPELFDRHRPSRRAA